MKTHRVFVYGTLKRGFPNHRYLAGATFIGEARTREAYPLVVGGAWFTPFLIPEVGSGHPVRGELWRVPEAMMPALDDLESTHLPDGYRRETIPVVMLEGGDTLEAWVYFRKREHIAVIHTGNLADYQDRRYTAAADRGP